MSFWIERNVVFYHLSSNLFSLVYKYSSDSFFLLFHKSFPLCFWLELIFSHNFFGVFNGKPFRSKIIYQNFDDLKPIIIICQYEKRITLLVPRSASSSLWKRETKVDHFCKSSLLLCNFFVPDWDWVIFWLVGSAFSGSGKFFSKSHLFKLYNIRLKKSQWVSD